MTSAPSQLGPDPLDDGGSLRQFERLARHVLGLAPGAQRGHVPDEVENAYDPDGKPATNFNQLLDQLSRGEGKQP